MAKRRSPHRRDSADAGLPAVAVLEITGTDADGEAVARPVNWRDDDRTLPLIHVLPDKRAKMRQAAPGAGERVLARLERTDANTYTARVIRRLTAAPERFIGLMEANGRIRPTDRRFVSEFTAAPGGVDAKPGELVIAEALGRSRRHGLREARVVEHLGRVEGTEAYSRVAVLGRDIPDTFSDAALAQAAAAGPAPLDDRADLRGVPLVTVDDEDARDFDDAVFAEPDTDAGNEGGWRLIVAIADVAWYVRHGDALDREARERGNSVYLPDKVVPMLPEALSNGWCSLQPEEERPCLAMHMVIDRNGRMISHRLERGLMRSAARLTYRQIAAFWDGDTDAVPAAVAGAARNLDGAFQALLRERARRRPLELVLPERRVVFEEGGGVRIEERPHFASHRMIEEFMIAANIAAAEIIGKRNSRALFRVHDEPPPDKLAALVETLEVMGYPTPKGQVLLPQHFNGIIEMATDENERALLSDLILRSQAQAIYAAADDGHFGLRLRHYAHFTSPIRRYADLVVHRALIKSLGLGPGGWTEDAGSLDAAAEHVSMTERRAVDAEREAMDRFSVAAAERTTEGVATGRVTGVIRAGLFVTLDGIGSDGFIPKRLLPRDSYIIDEAGQSLRGRRSKRRFQLGDRLEVTIKEADPLAARLLLEPAGETRASNSAKPPEHAKKSKKARKSMG